MVGTGTDKKIKCSRCKYDGRWRLTPRGVFVVAFDDADRLNRVLQVFKKAQQKGRGEDNHLAKYFTGSKNKKIKCSRSDIAKKRSKMKWFTPITVVFCSPRSLKRELLSPRELKRKKKNNKGGGSVLCWGGKKVRRSLPASELRAHLEKATASLINLSLLSPSGRPLPLRTTFLFHRPPLPHSLLL